MNIKDLLKEDSIILNSNAKDKNEAIHEMVEKHFQCGHIKDKFIFEKAILEREKISSTGVGNLIAIPHAQSETVCYPSLVAMVNKNGIDYDALDQKPVSLFFMIAVPKDGGSQHLQILAQLCQMLMEEGIVKQLINSQDEQEFIHLLFQNMDTMKDHNVVQNNIDLVAVTACPTGIAHTYMAEKALIEKAKEMNISIKVETNGASGIQHKLTKEDIEKAKCVIVAVDKKVEMERFQNKYVIQVPVTKAIDHTEELLKNALQQKAEIYHGKELYKESNEKGTRKIYQHLMNGISQIIPILMISGILMSLIPYLQNMDVDQEYLTIMYYIASLAINIAIPITSAFIGDSIAGKQGFVVSLISSIFLINVQGNIIEGILVGFIGGYLALGLSHLFSYLPKDLQSLTPNLFVPIIGTTILSFLIYMLAPYFIDYVSLLNQNLDSIVIVIIGAILGMMMSIDLGGPINKIAYTIGIIGIFTGRYDMMSAVMLAGMMPPLIIWLTMLTTKVFDQEDKQKKWSCLLNGLCFVSEVAIPYMKKYKSAVKYPCIIASSIASALSMYFQCGQAFPHGGIWTIFLINSPIYFISSLMISLIIGILLIVIMNKLKLKA